MNPLLDAKKKIDRIAIIWLKCSSFIISYEILNNIPGRNIATY